MHIIYQTGDCYISMQKSKYPYKGDLLLISYKKRYGSSEEIIEVKKRREEIESQLKRCDDMFEKESLTAELYGINKRESYLSGYWYEFMRRYVSVSEYQLILSNIEKIHDPCDFYNANYVLLFIENFDNLCIENNEFFELSYEKARKLMKDGKTSDQYYAYLIDEKRLFGDY